MIRITNSTRDDIKWWVSMIGAAAVGVTANVHQFPWLSEQAQHVIGMVAFLYGIVAGKLATSPLPGKIDPMSEAMSQRATPSASTPKDVAPELPPAA